MVKIHFLNVGHGDCIVIENFDTGRNTIIDINRSVDFDKTTSKELLEIFEIDYCFNGVCATLESKGYNIEITDPIQYLKDNNISDIHRFISTHPHMDHISGIKLLYDEIKFINVWIANHNWQPNLDKLSEKQKINREFYEKLKNQEVENVKVINSLEGSKVRYLPEDGLSILAPNENLLESNNANDLSYVIKFEYAGRKIIFGGDAEEKTWKYIFENYDISNMDILKASHHGRDSGYYQPAVKAMSPKYTIVSVGKKPSTDASNKYRRYSDNIWSTRWKGNIVFTIDGNGNINYDWEYDR
jgi:beta-lactamase superfamily II metal-dependent hydrolase